MTNPDPVALTDALLARGQRAQAIATIDAAARAGHAEARFRHAIWQLIGDPVPRDLPGARATLRVLASAGHSEAQLIEVALTANGSGAPADWNRALRLLRAAAGANHGARTQLDLVAAMSLGQDGAPIGTLEPEWLTADGAVRRQRGFLSRAECAHLARSAADLLAPAQVSDPATGRPIANPVRTCDSAVIGPVREDLAIRSINRRIAALSDTPIAAGEALTILRYGPGQQFRSHSDALPNTRNQRVKTVLVYLNDGFGGGETVFPEHAVTVRPAVGDAILFTNTLATGQPDPRARHAGLPVTSGVKWLATRWIRARAFDVWTGPEPTD